MSPHIRPRRSRRTPISPRRRLTEERAVAEFLRKNGRFKRGESNKNWKDLSKRTRRRLLHQARKELDAIVLPDRSDVINYTLWKYAAPGAAASPVIFTGSNGVGKTYECRQFAREAGFDHFVEIAAHRGMESIDLQGQILLGGDGATFWKDGGFSQVVRAVGTNSESDIELACERGVTAIILLDEIFRMPRREREILLTALQPEKIRGIPVYKIRTGRPLGSGPGTYCEETIYAPQHLLSIVATTNLGIAFDVENDDDAARERWVKCPVKFSEAKFVSVVKQHLKERDFDVCWAAKFLTLYKALENARNDHLLAGGLTLRTAARIIENAIDPDDFGATIMEVGQIWVETAADGEPLPEQLKTLATIIVESGFTIEPC